MSRPWLLCMCLALASCGGRLATNEPSDDASVLDDAPPAETAVETSPVCEWGDWCGGRCVDRMSDELHCGACDFPCRPGAVCVSGICGCIDDRSRECGGACIDPRNDPNNCGSCGVRCASGTCAGGECVGTGPGAPPDRLLTLLFAAPDMPPRFVCFGAFASSAVPSAMDAPAAAMPSSGAIGVPDPTLPSDTTKTTGFPYGAVVRVPLSESMVAALKVFQVAVYLLDQNPASIGSTCAAEWKNVKGDPRRWKVFAPNTVVSGDHALLSMFGCLGPPDLTGRCGTTGNNFEFRLDKLSQSKWLGGNFGVQVLHLSQYPGVGGAPSWQDVDVYLAPLAKPLDPGASVPASAAVRIAQGIKYNQITVPSGITLPPDANPDHSYLIVAPRIGGAPGVPCSTPDGRPSAACPNYTLPLRPFIGTAAPYPRTGGGFFANTNQLVAISGSPVVPSAGGPPSLRIPFVRSVTW